MDLLSLKSFDQHIQKILQILNEKLKVTPKFGVEIEFYLRSRDGEIADVEQAACFTENLSANGISIIDEKGEGQFETQINYTECIAQLLKDIASVKSTIVSAANKLELQAIFRPKPFTGSYGSSMHFHLSLHDEVGHNLFSVGAINENEKLNNVIYSILFALNSALYLICGHDPEEYSRFSANFMAPVNVSWGGNNRSTAIRIPNGSILQRRVEFRVPSASCDPQKVIFFLLLSVLGADVNINHGVDRVYGDAAHPQYNLTLLSTTPEVAKRNYALDDLYDEIMSRYL
jgi:glutamine synthetase